jgi:hypothetical protein
MRPHCTKGQKRLPWDFGPEAEQIVGDYVRLRYRLLPTIYAAARRAYDDGTPLMRRLDLEWPDHAEAADNTEYLLGDDLLVAPMHGNPAVPLTAADVKTPAGEPGFLGEYFASKDLSGTPAHTRTDGEINFDWAMGEPAPGLPADSFSVRWTGTIGPVATGGEAVFAVTADDGVRLWVNDQLVVDQWVDQAATEWTAAVDMKAGKSYEVKVEYFENAGNAICQLLWQPPGHPPTNARSVWLPPGVWHDAWTGAAATGPVAVQATLPLRQMPLYFRDGGIIATIPQIEHTAAAAWPTVVLDVFVPDEPSELVPADSLFVRTERVIYEDDGTSPGYRVGQYSVTPVVLERNGCGTRLVLGPTAGTFPGLPATRSWVVRLHLPRGTEPDSLTVAGDEWPLGPPQAAIPGHLLEPAAGDLMPLSGQLSAPGSDAGPVAELWLSDQDVRAAIEIGLVTRTER